MIFGNRISHFYLERQRFTEFICFCIVGIVSASIDAVVFYMVRTLAIYQVALCVGYLTGLIFNCFLNIYWTFSQKPSIENVVGVVSAHLINLFLIRMGLMWLFVSAFDMSDKVAYIPTIVISVIANFLMVKFAVSKTSK